MARKLGLKILVSFGIISLLVFGVRLIFPAGGITASLIGDYLEASYQLAGLFHVDGTKTDYDTWRKTLALNQSKWKKIENQARFLKWWYQFSSFVSITQAQDTEVSLRSHQLETEIKLIFNQAPPGQKIKKVMAYLQADAKTAQQAITRAYQIDAQTYQHRAKAHKALAEIAAETRDASFILVNVGGVIITGGEMLAAKQAALLALKSGARLQAAQKLASAAYSGLAVAFNGADAVLAIGEKGAVIMDNRKLKSVLVDAREKIGPVTTVLAITDFKSLRKGFKKGFAREPSHWVTLEGYAEALASWLNQDPQNPPRMTVNISPKGTRINYNLDSQIQSYFTSPPAQIIFNQAPSFLPSGNYIILNKPLMVNNPASEEETHSDSHSKQEAHKKDILKEFCSLMVGFGRINKEKMPFGNEEECYARFQEKIEKTLQACPKAKPEERKGIPCTKEAIRREFEKVIINEEFPLMKKYCQKECHQEGCSQLCSRINDFKF